MIQTRLLGNRMIKGCAWGCGGAVVLSGLLIGLLVVFLNRVPDTGLHSKTTIEPPRITDYAAFDLDGFESPYIGHTGS